MAPPFWSLASIDLVEEVCTRVIIMDRGTSADGSVQELASVKIWPLRIESGTDFLRVTGHGPRPERRRPTDDCGHRLICGCTGKEPAASRLQRLREPRYFRRRRRCLAYLFFGSSGECAARRCTPGRFSRAASDELLARVRRPGPTIAGLAY